MNGIPLKERKRLGALLDTQTQESVMTRIPQFHEAETDQFVTPPDILPEEDNWYFDRQKRIGGRLAVFTELDVGGGKPYGIHRQGGFCLCRSWLRLGGVCGKRTVRPQCHLGTVTSGVKHCFPSRSLTGSK